MAADARLHAAEEIAPTFLRQLFDSSEASRWKKVRLGNLLVPYKEMIHPGDRAGGTAVFVGLEHIESHTGRRIGSATVNFAKMSGRKPAFRRGQIVYGYLRPYLNKVWIADFDGVSSVDQYAFDVRGDMADIRFVAWFMRSPTYMRRSRVQTTTGQLPRIGTQAVAAVEIALPSLNVQRRIADECDRQFEAEQSVTRLLSAQLAAINALPPRCCAGRSRERSDHAA